MGLVSVMLTFGDTLLSGYDYWWSSEIDHIPDENWNPTSDTRVNLLTDNFIWHNWLDSLAGLHGHRRKIHRKFSLQSLKANTAQFLVEPSGNNDFAYQLRGKILKVLPNDLI